MRTQEEYLENSSYCGSGKLAKMISITVTIEEAETWKESIGSIVELITNALNGEGITVHHVETDELEVEN